MIKNVNLLMPGGGVVGRSEKILKNQKLLIFGICNTSQQHTNMFIQQTPWRYNDFIKDIPSIIFISSCIWINHLHVSR